MFNFNPKEDKFFSMFIGQAKNIHEAAIFLKKGFENLDKKKEINKEIAELEHKGDKMVHDNLIELNEAFITPIDREDVFRIIKKMDNILDDIDSAGSRLIMYNVNVITEASLQMCDMILDITKELLDLMEELKKIGKRNNIVQKIKKINEIEHTGDKLYRKTITELFKGTDAIEIVKWKDIYTVLENTLDNCEQIAAIIEGVVMKHA